jgi:hypothetical protein
VQDIKTATMVAHHQKTVIGGGALESPPDLVNFLGGIDPCDGRQSGSRELWNDIHCRLVEPAAWDVLENFEQRWKKQDKGDNLLVALNRAWAELPENNGWANPRSGEGGRWWGLDGQGDRGMAFPVLDEMPHDGSEAVIVPFSEGFDYPMFDEMSAEEVVWDAEVLLGCDSRGLCQRLAHEVGDQMHSACEKDVVPDAPWMFVGMSQQASTHPVFREMGPKVAWDEEMQTESHMHEGLLKQLAQGGEALKESANKDDVGDDVGALRGEEALVESTKKDSDVEDEASRPHPPREVMPDDSLLVDEPDEGPARSWMRSGRGAMPWLIGCLDMHGPAAWGLSVGASGWGHQGGISTSLMPRMQTTGPSSKGGADIQPMQVDENVSYISGLS